MTPTTLSETRQFFELNTSQQVTVHIAKQYIALFPPLESYLKQPIEIRGWLAKRGEHYHLWVYHPGAMVLQ